MMTNMSSMPIPRQSSGSAGCIGVQGKPRRELRLMATLIPIPMLSTGDIRHSYSLNKTFVKKILSVS